MWKCLATGLELDSNLFCHSFVQLFGTATNSNHHGGVAIIIVSGHDFFGKIPRVSSQYPSIVFLLSSSVSVRRPSCARVFLNQLVVMSG